MHIGSGQKHMKKMRMLSSSRLLSADLSAQGICTAAQSKDMNMLQTQAACHAGVQGQPSTATTGTQALAAAAA
jgi:hypothetical protein